MSAHGLNNPVKYKDPTGHYVVDATGGARDLDDIVNDFYESEDDTPLALPIVVGTEVVGMQYWMPEGSEQSSVNENTATYRAGRILAGMGIGADVVELILTTVPGASLLPGYGDALITYASGLLTGDNYVSLLGRRPPQGLPNMWFSTNQDTVVNGVEAVIPPVAAAVVGAGGVLAGLSTPVPGDELVYGGMAVFWFSLVDATTSTASAFYDYGRFTGEIQNSLTLGFAPELTIIHWR